MAIESRNPLNNEIIKTFSEESDKLVADKVNLAHDTYQSWKDVSFSEKSNLMQKAANELRENKEKYAKLMVIEMGKPIKEAYSEVEKCASCCDYYAEHAEAFLANEALNVPEGQAYITYEPIGAVLAVMPWNFPLWQVFRFAAPNLMAGNVGLLKHASNVPQCALAIEEIFLKAGFPKGAFQTLLISSSKVNSILDDKRIVAATLTGSEGAGSAVAERAGKNLKKTVLELGGSDPFIVCDDADLDLASKTGMQSRMINTGQSCIAAKRFILHKDIAEEFLQKFRTHFDLLKIGDPMDENNDYGPMAREDLADELLDQVNRSVEKGAKILIGGKRMKREGAFIEPTILTDVKKGMPAYEEELFGPVAIVIIANSNEEAVAIANDSRFGLGGSLWSKDIKKAQQLARRVESGAVYINKMMASHPAVPFGGIKMSGFGRELSHLGIREFINQKTIWINN